MALYGIYKSKRTGRLYRVEFTNVGIFLSPKNTGKRDVLPRKIRKDELEQKYVLYEGGNQ